MARQELAFSTFSSTTGSALLGNVRGHVHATGDFVASTLDNSRIATNAITQTSIQNGSVTRDKIANNSVTLAKLGPTASGVFDSGAPSGLIAIWSGAVATIPTGWRLCDGSNGTPDLRGRFVYGGASATMTTGGTETHTLTADEMPNHHHNCSTNSAGAHSHTVTAAAGGHTHSGSLGTTGSSHNHGFTDTARTWDGTRSAGTGSSSSRLVWRSEHSGTAVINTSSGTHNHSVSFSGNTGAHTHSGSLNSSGGHTHALACANRGSGQAHENMPPFLVLAFIQKI